MVAATVAVRLLLSSSGTTSTMSAPARSRPRQPRMSASACAELGPPTSGVPTAGAKPGSTKSASTVMKALRSPIASTAAATTPVPSWARSSQGTTVKPSSRACSYSSGVVEAAAHAEEGGARGIHDALLRGAADHRAVDVPLPGALSRQSV